MDDMSDDELLDVIDEYADEHPNFDNSFAESLRDKLSEYDELTSAQRYAAENIIRKFRMLQDD